MRSCVLVLVLVAPAAAWAQYIGNPAGKASPLGASFERYRGAARGFSGLDFGYASFDVDADYHVTTNGIPGELSSVSELRQSYFAASAGGHFEGFEFEGRLGGAWIDIRDDALAEDPLDDGNGILAGMGARYGFSPCEFLRLGGGGQFEYSYIEGDSLVSDGLYLWDEEMSLDLFRGEVFGGASLDLETGRDVVFSPYLGGGFAYIDGELSIDIEDPCGCYWYEREVGDIEESMGFVFGGLDVHIGGRTRVGLEGRTDFDGGWSAHMSFGFRF